MKLILKKDTKALITLIILFIIGIFFTCIAVKLITDTKEKITEYKEAHEEVQFCTIQDNFVGDLAEELELPENTAKFRTFLNLMRSSEHFEYLMMYEHPVYIENYRGKDSNLYLYELNPNSASAPKEIPDKNGIIRLCENVKAFWIGDNVIDYFKLELSEGRGFENDEFILSPNEPIPVILGANYADEYDIGDSLFVNFIFSDSPATVVGFLEKDAAVYYKDNYVNLNNYVILPIFQNDDYNGKEIYNFSTNHFYTLRNQGVVASKLKLNDIKKIIEDYSDEAGFDEDAYYIYEYSTNATTDFGFITTGISFLACIATVLIVIISIILFIAVILKACHR